MVMSLPTYNEAGNLEGLILKIKRNVPEMDILVIDDGSPDGTGDVADRLASKDRHVKVIHRPAKSGRGSATQTGFKYAIENGYDLVLEMDVDGSHNPEELPAMIAVAADADLVIGSRFIGGGYVVGWNWRRKLIHFAADTSVKVILGTPNTDHTNGLRCYRVQRLKVIDFARMTGYGYIGQTVLENLFYRLGYKIKELPSVFGLRETGASKMGKGEMINGLKKMIKFRWNLMKHGVSYFLK